MKERKVRLCGARNRKNMAWPMGGILKAPSNNVAIIAANMMKL